MSEEVDQFAQDFIYPLFSPSIGLFLLISSIYGLWKASRLPQRARSLGPKWQPGVLRGGAGRGGWGWGERGPRGAHQGLARAFILQPGPALAPC
jgi:hypothetical protein